MAMKLFGVSFALAAPLASAGFFDDLANTVNSEAEKHKQEFNNALSEAKKSAGLCSLFGCGTPYTPTNSCQCNSDCTEHGSCCKDYQPLCGSNDLAKTFNDKLGEAQNAVSDAAANGDELAQKLKDSKESALAQVAGAKDQLAAQKAKAEQLAQEAREKAGAAGDSLSQQAEAHKQALKDMKAKAQDAATQAQAQAQDAAQQAQNAAQQAQAQAQTAAQQAQNAAQAQAQTAAQQAQNAAQQAQNAAQAQAEATEASIDQAKAKVEGFADGAQSEAKKDVANVAAALREKSGSCAKYGCKTAFNVEHSCHCTEECVAKGDCCFDYKPVCTNGLGNLLGQAQEHAANAAALRGNAKDALANAGDKAKEAAAELENNAKDKAQNALDAATSALGKADEVKQCGDKAVKGLDAAKACVEADATQVCNCVADFNSSTQSCSALVNGLKSLDALPGAAACKSQVLKSLKGKFKLSLSNAEAFLGKDSAVKAVENAVSKMAGCPAKYVSVFLKPLKDMGLGRRLEEAGADVEADYTITVPESSPLFSNLDEEAGKKLQESMATAKDTLQQEIASTVGDGFTLSAVAEEVAPASPEVQAFEAPAPVAPGGKVDETNHGQWPWYAYAGMFLVVAALIAGVSYVCLGDKKGAKKTKKRAVASRAAAPAPAAAVAPAVPMSAGLLPQYAPVAQYSLVQQAPLLHATAPVPTQAYHTPVYQPAAVLTSSPRSFVAATHAPYVPNVAAAAPGMYAAAGQYP